MDDRAVGDIRLPRPARRAPILHESAITGRGIDTGVHEEIAGIDRVARAELEGLRIAAHHPKRGMRALQWLHGKLGALGMELVAVKREGLRLAEGGAQITDEFHRRRLAATVIESKRTNIDTTHPRHAADPQHA